MSLQARKDQVAISDKFGSITYGELDIKSNKVAKILHDELGEFSSRQQHSVSFLCGNDSTYSNTLFGIWKSGNIAVPLSISHPSSSLEYYIQDSESVAIITTKHFVDKIHHFADKRNVKLFLLEDMFLQGENHGNMENIINEENVLDQDALILYTSGTTGSPKGVVHTHNSLISQVNGMTVSWEWSKNDNILHILPLHHVHGLVNCLLTPLAIGAKVKMLPKFDAGDTWKIFLNAGKDNLGVVNVFMAVPTVYAKLIEYYQINQSSFSNIDVKKVLMKNMRLMVCGSAALPNKIINEWHSITGHRLLEQYGMTEIGRALGNPYHQVSRIPGFVGKPFPGVEVRIVETGTNNVLVIGNHNGTIVNQQGNQNLTGDLQIKGPNVFKNYFNKAEATRKEFTVDGWFKTGDVAEYVALSYTYRIVGRSSVDIIKSGGYKIGTDIFIFILKIHTVMALALAVAVSI